MDMETVITWILNNWDKLLLVLIAYMQLINHFNMGVINRNVSKIFKKVGA